MLSTDRFLAFLATSFVVIAVPGPSVMFTISRAMTVGRRGALLTVVGNTAGVYVQVVAVAFGVGALVERSILAYTVLRFVGAAYVVYLGVQAIRHRHALSVAASARGMPAPTRRLIADGFLVGVANPKTIVFFAAIAPQFIDRNAGQFTGQLLVLGAAFCSIALISDSVWATVAGSARAWFAKSPRRMASVSGAGGLAMIGIGATLAVSGRTE
jgi:threonine/homoserine/homoserine lactone efflux protein